MKNILVTGGLGYIGSHTCVELLNEGYGVIVADNLSNSNILVIDRIKKITGKDIKFYEIDIREKEKLENVFRENEIYGVIHFAGFKAVGESVEKPLMYYNNNIYSTIVLLEVMKEYNVKNLIFSSSATLYGNTKEAPIKEEAPLSALNAYGRSKLMIEEILRDLYTSDNEWNLVLLRYFNPIGAHESGEIGEVPNGIPNNLLPYVAQVAVGKLECINVFGNDYDTHDGTGVRDYIHVVDLAKGHIKSIKKFDENPEVRIYNLGTGNGYSVLDVIHAYEKACGKKLSYKIVKRRQGDMDLAYADATKAKKELNWEAKYNLKKMCIDSWNWQKNNPNGYRK